LPTTFGFTGWIAMTVGAEGNDVLMGDLVLREEEVNPVMSALLKNDLDVTALHNHFFYEEPRLFFMHVYGMGKAIELAKAIKPALDIMGTLPVKGVHSVTLSGSRINAGTFDTAALDAIVGTKGSQLDGGVYKYVVGRPDLDIQDMDATINARMGLSSWASLFGSDDDAVIAGDIAMVADEVTFVMKALRSHNIEVVAVHNHMTGTTPMIYFLHYWGEGKAADLAKGFKAAIDATGKD
ncbi:MAG TPA: DUF1259 domain-containing protein, partial [Fimbriimonadaceae bacterium]|nr:DUF1259 domain-containing protein [Fimbriimonadaceae bacterium]